MPELLRSNTELPAGIKTTEGEDNLMSARFNFEQSSPSRKLKVKFNQVSAENPFQRASRQRNSSVGLTSNSSDELGLHKVKTKNFKAEFDKIGNISPDQRAKMKMPDISYKELTQSKLLSGVQRFSDTAEPYRQMRNMEQNERKTL